MSFGFSVGDFIAVTELASKIRKDFLHAPSQFKAVSDEVRSLSIVLLDVEVVLSDRKLGNEQKAELKQIANGCRNILNDLEYTLNEYSELKSDHGSVNKRVKRLWKRLKWEPEDIKQLRSHISTNIGLLNMFTSRLIWDNMVTLVQNQEDQGYQAILDWITPIDYAPQQSDFINRRQAGTGQWLLESAQFKTWLQIGRQTLFCPGIPGAGKTILTSVVVKELSMRYKINSNIGIAYLYCNYQRQHEQKPKDLFASLLKQFVQEQPFIPDSVKTLYNQYKNKRTQPSLEEILGTLQSVVIAYSRVFIIVDALDECQVFSGYRQQLLLGLFDLQAKYGVNLFATSRPLLSIQKEFEGKTILEIRASRDDIQKYLESHMFRLPGFVVQNLELQEEIKINIIKAVDGMYVDYFEYKLSYADSARFLLVKLHLESLIGKRSPKAIRTSLENLATGSRAYDCAYKDSMERINSQINDQELAKQVLSWITCAKRPLTTIELQHALGVEFGESKLDIENFSQIEDIVSICAGLVTVDEESNIIRLVHYTTQEYFNRTREEWFPNAESYIARVCVTYLSFENFESGICQNDEEFKRRLQLNNLYDYAAHNWGYHAREASTSCQGVIDFLEKQPQVEASSQALMAMARWADGMRYSQIIPKQMTGLHLAAYFGVNNAVAGLLNSYHLDLKDSHSRTPLSWAAERGHENVVKLLLEQGAELNSIDSEYGQTPLSWAAKSGHEGVIQLLLEAGAEANVRGGEFGKSALHWAADIGSRAVVHRLVEAGADVNIRAGRWHRNASTLHWAATEGHDEVVRLLLKAKADVRAKDSCDWTALHWAADAGHEMVVNLLLEAGAVVNGKNSCGATALHLAARSGHNTVVEQLIEWNADFEARCRDGWTAMHWAAENMQKSTFRLLLGTETNVDAKDSVILEVPNQISKSTSDDLVKLMVSMKADVEGENPKLFGRFATWVPI